MTRKKNLLGIVVLQALILTGTLLNVSVGANGTTPWYTTWGGTSRDVGRGIALDASGAIYCIGETHSFGDPLGDLVLVKYYLNGTRAWVVTWGNATSDFAGDVIVDALGSAYCLGYTQTPGNMELIIRKYFSNGTLAWNATWGSIDHDYGFGLALDLNGSLVVCGNTEGFGATVSDALVARFNSTTGTLIEYNIYGGSLSDSLQDIVIAPNGSIYCVGYKTLPTESSELWLIKFHSNLSFAWEITWGYISGNVDIGYGLDLNLDGIIACVGETWISGEKNAVIKYFDVNQTEYSAHISSQAGDHRSLREVTHDSSGYFYCIGFQNNDLLLQKYQPLSGALWVTIWGGEAWDHGYGIVLDTNGSIYCVGETQSFGSQQQDLLVVKFNSNGTGPLIPDDNGIPSFNFPALVLALSLFLTTYLTVRFWKLSFKRQ